MTTYNIRSLQLRILQNLMALHRVCEEHNLRYYLWAGSMLGAVRHSGFIPWDDDIDIAMPRRDYDLLMSNAKKWMPEPWEVVSYETDPQKYPLPFAKIQDTSTTLIERMHLNYLGGIYIDVFPLDGMPKSKLRQRLHFIHYQWLKKALYFVHRDPFRHGHGISCWLPLLCRKIYTMQELQEKIRKLQKTYDYEECSLVVDHDDGLKGIINKTSLGKPTPILFENKIVWGVEKADDYLRQKYGEYLTIPNKEQQRQHNFHLLNLEKSYKDV